MYAVVCLYSYFIFQYVEKFLLLQCHAVNLQASSFLCEPSVTMFQGNIHFQILNIVT